MPSKGGEALSESTKVFWHGAFFEALQLEFHRYRDSLKFENEVLLSKEALKMDVLVIRKKPGSTSTKISAKSSEPTMYSSLRAKPIRFPSGIITRFALTHFFIHPLPLRQFQILQCHLQ